MNRLVWKIVIPVLAGLGATICAVMAFQFCGTQNTVIQIGAATIAGALGNQIFIFLGNRLMRLHAWLIRPRPGEVVFAFGRLPLDKDYAVQAGGKGRSLARMRQEGLPVPDGCVLLANAFVDEELSPQAKEQMLKEVNRLRGGRPAAFAVRSSALLEDSTRASFAGEYESVLDVSTDAEILNAIRSVFQSGKSTRVESYTRSQGIEENPQRLAVVIQKMVHPDFSGVLFTADPLTGNLSRMTGNFVPGLGEKLVSGQVNAQSFIIDRPSGNFDGPIEMQPYAKNLYRIAHRIETDFGCSQDLEWAVSGKKIFILQARPITTLNSYDPVNAVWNDSLKGEFLWSATNLMEACPEVLTPLTASMLPYLTQRGGPSLNVKGYPINGIIGGRFYVNISVQVSAFARLFKGDVRRTYQELSGWWGDIPAGMEIPLIPLTREEWFKGVIPELMKSMLQFSRYRKKAQQFLRENRENCRKLDLEVRSAKNGHDLFQLWNEKIFPYYRDSYLYVVSNSTDVQVKVEQELRDMVGEEDAIALMSNLGGLSHQLESLGPMAGLGLVADGKMSREEYLDHYGHRGVNEGEVAWPRPSEDPDWLDHRLAEWKLSPVDVKKMLESQHAAFEAAWDRFCLKLPAKVAYMEKRLDKAAKAARTREQVRSEATRGMSVFRSFCLRAGNILGIGNDVFFLTIDEVLPSLSTQELFVHDLIPRRKDTYERYRSLPPYPAFIRGRFDPFAWAADPNRRRDLFDAASQTTQAPGSVDDGKLLTGFAGALGVVEGTVRRLDSLEESGQFEAGEVLVTKMTNIGWTPLFPRAAAIITDLGAPLSHAAIVARELGIPAVVGCGDATSRLKTGDRVRVYGGRGLVEILQ
ncbi:MAG: hypothetical protein GX577_09655 [Leptolinea sp.]|nr:hypothetical protein [Leptolinea sp.]